MESINFNTKNGKGNVAEKADNVMWWKALRLEKDIDLEMEKKMAYRADEYARVYLKNEIALYEKFEHWRCPVREAIVNLCNSGKYDLLYKIVRDLHYKAHAETEDTEAADVITSRIIVSIIQKLIEEIEAATNAAVEKIRKEALDQIKI